MTCLDIWWKTPRFASLISHSKLVRLSTQCFITISKTLKFVTNTPLRVVFSTLFSVFDMWWNTVSRVWYITSVSTWCAHKTTTFSGGTGESNEQPKPTEQKPAKNRPQSRPSNKKKKKKKKWAESETRAKPTRRVQLRSIPLSQKAFSRRTSLLKVKLSCPWAAGSCWPQPMN